MFNIQPYKEVVKTSSDGSVTIPKSLCEQIGLVARAECVIRNNEIIVRPYKDIAETSVEGYLMRELMSRGFSCDALEAEYDRVRPRFYAAARRAAEQSRFAFESSGELCRVEELPEMRKAGECRLLLTERAERFFRGMERGEARDALGRALAALSKNPYRGTPLRKLLSDFYVFTVMSGEERFDIIYRIYVQGKKVTAIVSALSIEEMYNEIRSNME